MNTENKRIFRIKKVLRTFSCIFLYTLMSMNAMRKKDTNHSKNNSRKGKLRIIGNISSSYKAQDVWHEQSVAVQSSSDA